MLRQKMGRSYLLFGSLCGKMVQGPCTPGQFSLTLLLRGKNNWLSQCPTCFHLHLTDWAPAIFIVTDAFSYRRLRPLELCFSSGPSLRNHGVLLYPALDPFQRKSIDKPGDQWNLRHGYACAIREDQLEKINLGMSLFEHSENTNAWDILEFKTHFGVTPWTRVDM